MRRLGTFSLIFGATAALAVGTWLSLSRIPTAAAQGPVQIVRTSTTGHTAKLSEATLTPALSPPGTEFYSATRGDSIPVVARHYLKRTAYLTSSELAEAIRKTNGNRTGNNLKAGEQILVPGILAAPIVRSRSRWRRTLKFAPST